MGSSYYKVQWLWLVKDGVRTGAKYFRTYNTGIGELPVDLANEIDRFNVNLATAEIIDMPGSEVWVDEDGKLQVLPPRGDPITGNWEQEKVLEMEPPDVPTLADFVSGRADLDGFVASMQSYLEHQG